MKYLISFCLIFTIGCYTPKALTDYTHSDLTLPTKNGQVFYEKIYTTPNTTKDDLFKRGRIWAVDYFKNAKNVLQISDKKAGQLTGKGLIDLGTSQYDMGYSNLLKFTFNIQYKDYKYRVQFYDFILTSTNALNGNSVTSSFEKVYRHYHENNMNKALMESRYNMKQRYAHYIFSLKRNLILMDKSLYVYETGKHETSF